MSPKRAGAAPPADKPIVIHQPVLHGVLAPGETAPVRVAVRTPPAKKKKKSGPQAAAPAAAVAEVSRRALSVDALRGINLAMMIFAFALDPEILPDWMYHRQTPGETVLDIPGITWQDVPFLSFVFTLAAALPIVLMPRVAKGETELGILFNAIRRGFLLFVFALLIGHSNTYFIGFTQEGRILSVIGFLIMCMLFTRRRPDWDEERFAWITRAGWVAAIAFLAFSPAVYDATFSLERRDQIINELMFAAVAGTIVWYATRTRPLVRLGVLAGAVALFAASHVGSDVRGWWYDSPVPWLVRPSYLGLLIVIIPGTFAGDWIARWMRAEPGTQAATWTGVQSSAFAFICLVSFPVVLIGAYNRWIAATIVAVGALGAAGTWLLRATADVNVALLKKLFWFGTATLLIGLVLDPIEGGIRKVPETLSWYFTATGLTMLMLAGLLVIIDIRGHVRATRWLIDIGQNSMFCYVVYSLFINSILEMIPALRPVMRSSPALSVTRSALSLLLVVIVVQFLTRRKIFWRT